ncbi:hypothetical protein KKC94_05530, partial [Patescibacteria group bacterium]|nr:hypothetical protein [Patescibacteria group bacterium]
MRNLWVFRSLLLIGVSGVLCFFANVSAEAASISWDGGGGDSLWETGTNWSGDSVPTDADDVTIDLGSGTVVDINATTTINSLTISDATTLNFDYDAVGGSGLIIDDGDLVVNSGATITHTAGTDAVVGTISIDVQTGDATITGDINVNGLGYSSSGGPGVPTSIYGGASYGGTGEKRSYTDTHEVYGSITAPVDLGSGSQTRSGGGAIRLTAANMIINGTISADANTAGNYGGGSGGSVYLTTTGQISGTGTISADGKVGGSGGRIAIYYATQTDSRTVHAYGSTYSNKFGGAGTVYLKDTTANTDELIIDNNDLTGDTPQDYLNGKTPLTPSGTPLSLSVNQITVRNNGYLDLNSDTTLTFEDADGLGWTDDGFIADNGGNLYDGSTGGDASDGPFEDGYAVTIPSGATLYGNTTKSFPSLTVSGTLTHSANYSTDVYGVNYTISGDLTVAVGGLIDVEAMGFAATYGSGVPTSLYAGASYGGLGAKNATSDTHDVYGSITAPVDLGSGSQYRSGGGKIQLTAANMIINGTISADAKTDGNYGGGSGGSVYLTTTGQISGTGTISADGKAGGSGGRIAIYYATQTDSRTVHAYGAAYDANRYGGAGTVYFKDTTANTDELIIDNNNLFNSDYIRYSYLHGSTPLTASGMSLTLSVDTLTVQNDGHLNINSDTALSATTINWHGMIEDNGGSLPTVTSGIVDVPSDAVWIANTARSLTSVNLDGLLRHRKNFDTELYRVDLTTSGNFTIGAGGSIDVDDLGFRYGYGTGAGSDRGAYGSGGGHGGEGGATADGNGGGGITYDEETEPDEIGSGGGSAGNAAGDGAGAVKLTVGGDLTLGGAVSANGMVGGAWNSGGGAGGSIWFTVTGDFGGTEDVTATGGDATGNNGGGGGGRIYIFYGTLSWTGSGSVAGGSSSYPGSIGTYNLIMSNSAPTAASVTGVQSTNGTKVVTGTVIIDDADDDVSSFKVEYSDDGGVSWYDPTLSSTVYATNGTPAVNNSNLYQISNVETISGANTVTFYWNINTDAPGVEDTDYQFRITPYDGTSVGSTASSSNFRVDTLSPTLSLSYSSTSENSSETVSGTTEANASIYVDSVLK